MDSSNLHPTRHVIDQMKARDISWAEVVEIVEYPETSYGPDNRGRIVYQKHDLSVVTGRDGGVITVLLRNTEQWTNEDAKNRRKDNNV